MHLASHYSIRCCQSVYRMGTGDFRDQPPIPLRKQRFAKKRDSRSARKQHQGRALTRTIRELED